MTTIESPHLDRPGDDAAAVGQQEHDEIGDLASAVRTMGQDIASRESRILDKGDD